MKIWNREMECMDRNVLKNLQLERIKKITQYAYDNVTFYRTKLDKAGIKPDKINSFEDFHKIPFTTKIDFRDNYPFGLFACPNSQITRIHASSGTTGKMTVVGYTRKDLDTWSELVARLGTSAGVTYEDIVQICFGYGLFTGGFGLHYGMEKIGAMVVPASVGNTERQLMLMKDFKVTTLVCTPSYALYLGEVIQEKNLRDQINLRLGLFGAEPWTNGMREKIESLLGISATDNYGLSEIMGPGISYECFEKKGMHIAEDHFYAEIIDSNTGELLEDGQPGELVLTTLTKEALPILRYRTKDITSIIPQPCSCGRTHRRMNKPTGRSDDMLIIRGVNVFPSQIESVLTEFDFAQPHYQIIVDRKKNFDSLEVLLELDEKTFTDDIKEMVKLENQIKARIENVLGIKIDLKLVEHKTLQRFEGKAKHVIDNRKLE
jgi:phenylacetate-CoA ligase